LLTGVCRWVNDVYEKRCAAMPWNVKDDRVKILSAVHGTSQKIAWGIANNGFVNLSVLDAGYYGRGNL